MDFTGKTAIITGAGGGIGRAICQRLAGLGASVVVNDVVEANARETAESCGEAKTLVDTTDITSPEGAREMVQRTVKELGSIDLLVNNAGITRDMFVMKMDVADWQAVINVNLNGTFFCTKAAVRPMMRQAKKGTPGSIVNIASVIGIGGNAGQANYAASKGGIIAFTKSMAKELGPRRIRVNAVAPGFIVTPMTGVLTDEVRDQILSRIPLGSFGEAAHVADAVAFLGSDRSAYVTGAVLRVDGGLPV